MYMYIYLPMYIYSDVSVPQTSSRKYTPSFQICTICPNLCHLKRWVYAPAALWSGRERGAPLNPFLFFITLQPRVE